MRKTLYFHIGHYKTGTTALQVFLANNRKKLMRQGVDYADVLSYNSKHSRLAFSLYAAAGVDTLMHGYEDEIPAAELWARVFAHAAASKADKVLISSEEFMRLGSLPRAAEILEDLIAPERARFDFRIIAYLRAPGAHLRSWYNQLVKMRTAPPDFNTAVARVMEPVHYDYGQAVQPWAEIFGTEAVTLRPYHEGLRHDDGLYRDFLGLLGLDFDRWPRIVDWIRPKQDVNPRIDERQLDLIRAMQLAGLGGGEQQWLLGRFDEILPRAAAAPAEVTEIAARALAGLESIARLPGNGVDPAGFAADPPRPDPAWRGELTGLIALLLGEQTLLRNRMLERTREMSDHLAAAEARIAALERRLTDDG